MPSITTTTISCSQTVECEQDPITEYAVATEIRSSRDVSREMIQAKPLVATFPLLPQLPKSLDDLQVDITTDNSAVILQYSVHVCPRSMRREMSLVFPDIVGKESRLLIIPTFQRTLSSMISYEVETQAEKDAKLHLFYRWGAELVDRLHAQGHWADITDPMSGMALFTSCGPSLYPDVEGAEALLRYTPFNLGSCFVMSHPQWGTHVYPATAFTLAPAEVVTRTLCEMQLSLQ